MLLLKFILLPLVPVYYLVIRIRNMFFEKNIYKSESVNANIVSVGNLTVGGSGKTPMVIYLAGLLKKEGKKIGVLSRGYGRKSKGYVLVSKGKDILTPVDVCGDEIYQTVRRSGVAAAVSEKRVIGAERLINDTGVDTIVLDDAFQHRWIKRDVNLILFEQNFLNDKRISNQCLLPTGIMREPFDSVNRADAVIINRKFSERKEIPDPLKKFFQSKKIFFAHYNTIEFEDIKKKEIYGLKEFERQKSLVVSGVANPFSFINALKQTNVDTQNQIIFRDHKHYTVKEVQKIRKEFYSTNSHSVVTTEKDAVKLSEYSKELDDIDIYFLKIELEMDEPAEFREFIMNSLYGNRGGNKAQS